MIKRVSLPFFRLRRKPAARATALRQRFFRLTAKTALTSLPALNGVKESAPRTWVHSQEARQ